MSAGAGTLGGSGFRASLPDSVSDQSGRGGGASAAAPPPRQSSPETRPKAPLGTITEIAAWARHNVDVVASDLELSPSSPSPSDEARLARFERYELQAVARSLLPGHRIKVCLLHRHPKADGVQVRRSGQTGLAYIAGLMVCGSAAVCATCGAKIAEHNCREIQAALETWKGRGGVPALLTFTMPHYRSQALSANLSALLGAFRALTGHRSYREVVRAGGLAHTVRALEITWGQRNGFHPHLHLLGFFRSGLDALQLEGDMARLWFNELHRQGVRPQAAGSVEAMLERGFRLQLGFTAGAEYVSKVGQTWGLAEEVAKANRKKGRVGHFSPADLLRQARDGSGEAASVFRHYAAATKGVHLLQWSRGAREALGLLEEQSDEEVAAGYDQADEVLCKLSAWQWRAVRHGGWRARVRLVELADFDADAARAFVHHRVAEYDRALAVGASWPTAGDAAGELLPGGAR